jgi:hypothetical protein
MGFHSIMEKPNFVGDPGVIQAQIKQILFADVRQYSPEVAGFAVNFAVM